MHDIRKHLGGLCTALLLLSALLPFRAAAATPWDDKSAVVFVYHRIGEDEFPDSNLRTELFQEHIEELVSGQYNVMALPDIIEALKNGRNLPPATVAITFESGHRSVLETAAPILLEHKFPFTIFISPDEAASNAPDYLNWAELKKLVRSGYVTLGMHPGAYARLSDQPRAEILRNINGARAAYRDATGQEPTLFAYPYGESSPIYRKIIADQNFMAAFGQQSGVISTNSDFYNLPRFTMTDAYGDLDRFQMTARALPLPVSDIEPASLETTTNPPAVGFTLDPSLSGSAGNLSCFASGIGKPDMQVIGRNRVELRFSQPFDDDRIRINCTMPGPPGAPDEAPRWRWFGLLLGMPDKGDDTETGGSALFIPAQDEPQ